MIERVNWSRLVIEATVIVFSILLALAIAQAYIQRKEDEARSALLAARQWDDSPSTWLISGTTTSSLRAAGAYLVSSDAIEVDDEKTALVTYWIGPEGSESQDVYRCVDIVANVDFAHAAQKCWKVLRASDRHEPVESQVNGTFWPRLRQYIPEFHSNGPAYHYRVAVVVAGFLVPTFICFLSQ